MSGAALWLVEIPSFVPLKSAVRNPPITTAPAVWAGFGFHAVVFLALALCSRGFHGGPSEAICDSGELHLITLSRQRVWRCFVCTHVCQHANILLLWRRWVRREMECLLQCPLTFRCEAPLSVTCTDRLSVLNTSNCRLYDNELRGSLTVLGVWADNGGRCVSKP